MRRHHAFHRHRPIDGLAAADGQPVAQVARLGRGAGQHQIAKARQAEQRFRPPAPRGGKAAHLGKAPRHQRRPRAVAQARPDGDARGDGDHVLQRPAKLGTQRIGAEIQPQRRRRQQRLQRLASRGRGRQRQRGGLAGGDIGGKAWPGQHRRGRAGQHIGDDFGRQKAGPPLHPLATGHQPPPGKLRLPGQKTAETLGRHGQKNGCGPYKRRIGGDGQCRGQSCPGQVAAVFAHGRKLGHRIHIAPPERDRAPRLGQHDRQRRAEGAGAQNRDITTRHASLLPASGRP
jgi:hypothetical protein